MSYALTEAEKQLIAPAVERANRHMAKHTAAVSEVLRLVSMRTGIPMDRVHYDPATGVASDRTAVPPNTSG